VLLRSNLRLLLAQLEQLAETPYFSTRFEAYISELSDVIVRLLERLQSVDNPINLELAATLADHIWFLTRFLTGSTTKQIPYEVTFAIERAVKEWTDRELLITTAILQESNFYFMGGSEAFFAAVESELQIVIASRPVQIALPYIYRHKPLFCVPLFHELGHFVDNDNKIVDTSLLLSPATSGPDLPDLPTSAEIAALPDLERSLATAEVVSHRQEYFADLFSASYVGNALSGFLQEFCPDQPKSDSHPSSVSRDKLLADFSSGTPNPVIEMFQEALKARGLPELRARATSIALEASFGNVRPFTPASDEELFGLFESAWNFLQTQWAAPTGPWVHFPEDDRVRLVNDLTEKSIRNHMLVEGWNASIDQQ